MSSRIDDLVNALLAVENALNVMGDSKVKKLEVQKVFSRMHRTLQQEFVRTVILPILEGLADAHANGWTDARNEASAKLAYKMLTAIKEEDNFLPFI